MTSSAGKTTPVKTYFPNPWGLYDMHGNAREWCEDWYDDYPEAEITDPTGSERGVKKVIRSVAYSDPAWFCRSANRYSLGMNDVGPFTGFRLVCIPQS
jgi:formylglycine-generating enzyme